MGIKRSAHRAFPLACWVFVGIQSLIPPWWGQGTVATPNMPIWSAHGGPGAAAHLWGGMHSSWWGCPLAEWCGMCSQGVRLGPHAPTLQQVGLSLPTSMVLVRATQAWACWPWGPRWAECAFVGTLQRGLATKLENHTNTTNLQRRGWSQCCTQQQQMSTTQQSQ